MKPKILLLCIALLMSGGALSAQSKATANKADSTEIYSRMIFDKLDSIHAIQKGAAELRTQAIEERRSYLKDSIQSEYGLMSKIEENTHPDFMGGWTLLAILSFVISALAFWSQRQTEKHTKNVGVKAQVGCLEDLVRHLYRNLVCTTSILLKYRNGNNKQGDKFVTYPSEANMLKLQALTDEFFLDIDVVDDDVFKIMHEQKLLFKNYNLEVAIASEHFSRKNIEESSLVNDIDNILFKPLFLTKKSFILRTALAPYERGVLSRMLMKGSEVSTEKYLAESVQCFVGEHFSKLKFENINSEDQYEMCHAILNNADFDKAMECQGKNGIVRSLGELFKDKDDKRVELLSYKDGQWLVDKECFIRMFFAGVTDKAKQKHKLYVILNAPSAEELCKLFGIQEPRYKDFATAYFDYWRGSEWEVSALLYNILKFDAILEMPRIGMIKHE